MTSILAKALRMGRLAATKASLQFSISVKRQSSISTCERTQTVQSASGAMAGYE